MMMHNDDAFAAELLDVTMDDPAGRLELVHGLREASQHADAADVVVVALHVPITVIVARLPAESRPDGDWAALTAALERAIRADERFAEFAGARWRLRLVDAPRSWRAN